jgi:hypothetical protein
VSLWQREASAPGYSLFANRNLCSAALIDNAGAIKNFWRQEDCSHWGNAELLDTGDLIVTGTSGGRGAESECVSQSRFVAKLSWQGELVWKRAYPAHHDVERTPSGQLLTLRTDQRMLPEVDPSAPVCDHSIALLDGDGRELERTSLYDVLTSAPELVRLQRGRGRGDLIHANSIEWIRPPAQAPSSPLYADSNVLFCTRHQDLIGIVDWKTKRLLWAWGPGEISGPHDATLLANGHILLFDNGISRQWSRVIEVDPLSRRIVWEYKAPVPEDFFTLSRGSSQRLANGNTLIAQSDSGRAFEVTPRGEIVWEFRNPFLNAKGERATIVRIKRYPTELVDAIVRRLGEGRREASS